MPEPTRRAATPPARSGSGRAVVFGVAIGFAPWTLLITIGLLGAPLPVPVLAPPATSFLVGAVLVWPARTRMLGAGLLVGSVLAGALTPVVALASWFAGGGS